MIAIGSSTWLEGRRRNVALSLWAAGGLGLAFLTARHFASASWPLTRGHPAVLAAVAVLFLVASVLKTYGWRRLFAAGERPGRFALAAALGGSSVTGVALPGRLDDAVRVAIVRRSPGCSTGIRALCLSLFMLGLIDTAALAPLAAAAAASPDRSSAVRAGLALVAFAGVGAAAVVIGLPRLVGCRRLHRFRIGRWLSPRTTSFRDAAISWLLVSGSWLVRATALVLLLGTLGVGFSFSLAILFVAAGAAAGAIPIGPAGAVMQAGAGAAVLVASGVAAAPAIDITVAGQTLGVLCGGALFVVAAVRMAVRRPLRQQQV